MFYVALILLLLFIDFSSCVQEHNFGLKSGRTTLRHLRQVPRIETLKALKGVRNGQGHPSQPIIIYEGAVKYGER